MADYTLEELAREFGLADAIKELGMVPEKLALDKAAKQIPTPEDLNVLHSAVLNYELQRYDRIYAAKA